MKKFALYHTKHKKLMGFNATAGNDGDICYSPELSGDNIWTVNTEQEAVLAATTKNEKWYESDEYETPSNHYVGELEVVELKIKINKLGDEQ